MRKRQPYIYTMPEQFMRDASVPIKWRLYGIINGYWISGRTVYASNEYFSKELGCSERQIKRALGELEETKLLSRNIQGFKRTILPRVTPDVTLGGRPASREGDAPRHHISISNSDSNRKTSKKKFSGINRRSMEYDFNVDENGDERPARAPRAKQEGKNNVALRIVRKFQDLAEKKVGIRPVTNVVAYKMALFAMNSGKLTEAQIYDLFDEWFELPKKDEDLVEIKYALSTKNINNYKVRNL